MNKRYMDFVPVKAGGEKASKKTETVTVQAVQEAHIEATEVSVDEIFAERKQPAGVSTGRKEPKYGVIEDFQPKFVRTEVAKRPLGEASAAKSKVVKAPLRSAIRGKKKVAEQEKPTATSVSSTAPIPRANFVNTEKVTKRPLSKNVYPKKAIVAEEKPSGPITIITKPEKDSRAGLIVAVILTIILGAAAGTVAFLLLPK